MAGTTVRALVRRPGGAPAVEEVGLREPGPGEVVVEVRAAGVCHSDLHAVNGDWESGRPLVLGHEAAGVVVGLGPGTTGVAEGDHVVLSWMAPCGRCGRCAAGEGWLCTTTVALDDELPSGVLPFTDAGGAALHPYLGLGAFAERVVVPETATVVVPHDLPFPVGSLLGCSVTTGIGAVTNTAGVRPGQTAVVTGCGGVGLSIVLGLALAGAGAVVAVDVSDDKLDLARQLGATHALRGDREDVPARVRELLGGADVAFEAIGRVPTIEQLPSLVRAGGKAVVVGMAPLDARVSFGAFDLADRGISILGCNYGSSVARVDVPALAALHAAGRLPLERIISGVGGLDDVVPALADMARGVGTRVVVDPRA